MRIRRIVILLFMGLVAFVMVTWPALTSGHSKRTRTAYRNFFESRTEETRLALEEAKRLDRKDMLRFELTCTLVLATAARFFIRAKPKSLPPPQ